VKPRRMWWIYSVGVAVVLASVTLFDGVFLPDSSGIERILVGWLVAAVFLLPLNLWLWRKWGFS
jgi:hypothetical protein